MKLRNRAASKGIWVLPLLSCVALFCVVSPTLPAQDIEPKSRCHFEFFDFGNIERFRQFDDELKTALKSDDAAMLAQLVAFPHCAPRLGSSSMVLGLQSCKVTFGRRLVVPRVVSVP